jgi:hypothetical protein
VGEMAILIFESAMVAASFHNGSLLQDATDGCEVEDRWSWTGTRVEQCRGKSPQW